MSQQASVAFQKRRPSRSTSPSGVTTSIPRRAASSPTPRYGSIDAASEPYPWSTSTRGTGRDGSSPAGTRTFAGRAPPTTSVVGAVTAAAPVVPGAPGAPGEERDGDESDGEERE